MADTYIITSVEDPPWDVIGGALTAYNTQMAGDDQGQNLCFVLKSPEDEITGGVIGATYWDWLYVNLMWVQEDLRGRGFGRQLLSLAEEEARRRGAKNAYLDTFSFQAPDFYKSLGYKEFGRLENFPTGHTRYFLTKAL
jgi:GNAT superfamily N-acetyltransferase